MQSFCVQTADGAWAGPRAGDGAAVTALAPWLRGREVEAPDHGSAALQQRDVEAAGQKAIGLPADAAVGHGHESRMFGVNRHLMRLFRELSGSAGMIQRKAYRVLSADQEVLMGYPSETVPIVATAESVATFEWRKLHFHIVTRESLMPDQVSMIERVLPKVKSVGQFADVVGMVLGRSVRIRTERPSPDIRFEVGL